jgi:hypothetical protein
MPTVNRVFGHVIYKPIETTNWKIQKGMKTLAEFMSWQRRKGLEQKERDHPLALEIYCVITTKKPLNTIEFRRVVTILKNELLGEYFSGGLVEQFMEWGIDYYESAKIEPLEARKRYSRNGEVFEFDNDITWRVEGAIDFEYFR